MYGNALSEDLVDDSQIMDVAFHPWGMLMMLSYNHQSSMIFAGFGA